ncbi:uncharacterized protein CCDC197 isoform X1 [Lethenteron reissneri]|uniref:uncharacterized protein CCDC197 isoform X1 n=1 Tax=Lethenteron reissneri TaxID=7753 RepID=UPI002AB7B430|nr:uncharacterized protein CCDC197 isoform X1 [Lethenteron reissneri]
MHTQHGAPRPWLAAMDAVRREEEEERGEKRGDVEPVKFQIRRIERRNIFVTQLGEGRDEDENIKRFPVVKEGPSRLLEAPGAAPQETLLLRREVERRRVDAELEEARGRFRRRMEECGARGRQLQQRRKEEEDRALQLQQVLREQDARTRRALTRQRKERAETEAARGEAERLRELLMQLQRRCQKLQRATGRCKVYEDFLKDALDRFPEGDAGGDGHDTSGLIRRHTGLEAARVALLGRLGDLGRDLEQAQLQLAQLTRGFSHTNMVTHGEMSELRSRRERAQERCRAAEERLLALRQHHRTQGQELGAMLMAIDNLAESCYLRQYGSLQDMDSFSKLDMVQECLLERMEVLRAVRSVRHAAPSASSDRSRKTEPWGPRAPRSSAPAGSLPRPPLPPVSGQSGRSGRQGSTRALLKITIPAVK